MRRQRDLRGRSESDGMARPSPTLPASTAGRRLLLPLALLPGLIPLCVAVAGSAPFKTDYFFGKVTRSGDARAFVTDDAKTYPLLKDRGSMMFFKDAKLLDRPMRLTGRVTGGRLQVVNVHSLVKGKLHDVYYWCEVCQIKRFEPGVCDCCGADLDFREPPAK